jgi:hypothetical protein
MHRDYWNVTLYYSCYSCTYLFALLWTRSRAEMCWICSARCQHDVMVWYTIQFPHISKAVRCRVNCAVHRPRQDSVGSWRSESWVTHGVNAGSSHSTSEPQLLQQHRTRAVCSVFSPSERVQQFFFAHVTTSKSLTWNAEHLGVVQCHYFIRQLSVNSSCRLVSRHNVFCRSPTRASGSERRLLSNAPRTH